MIGDRMDNIHPGAMPWLHRYVGNPVLTRRAQPLLPHRRERRALRHARLRRDVLPRLDLRTTGMEFASEMVIRAGEGRTRHPAVPDRVPPARAASPSCRASVTAGATCASCWCTAPPPVHHPGRGHGRARHARRRSRCCCRSTCSAARGTCTPWSAGALLMIVGHPGAGARSLRARLRHVLHGREGPLVRPDARPLPARARAAARRRLILGRAGGRRGDRRASGSTAGSARSPRSGWPCWRPR